MKHMNWTHDEATNSYHAEKLGFKFEVISSMEALHGMLLWSYKWTPPYELNYICDHDFQYDTAEDAMEAADSFAVDIGYD